jgi:hypothetical protein
MKHHALMTSQMLHRGITSRPAFLGGGFPPDHHPADHIGWRKPSSYAAKAITLSAGHQEIPLHLRFQARKT